MKMPTCFFCYAWGEELRYAKLEYLRSSIINKSRDRIEVVLDRHTYEDNEDFNELRERIWSYDLVVVFCTPDFKEILLDSNANMNKNREVLKEYRIIIERYQKDANSVFPVILEGTKKTALFDIFSNRNARQFELFNFSYDKKKGGYFIPQGRLQDYSVFVGKLINTTLHNFENKSEEYKTTQEALDKLFGLTDNVKIPNSCLVKPELYEQIQGQRCYFVAGRKGSGKSTFIYNYRDMDRDYFDENYKKLIPLSAEDFQHENAYELLIAKHRKDRGIIDPHSLLILFWQVYFVFHSIIIIRAEIEEHNIREDDNRFGIFDRISRKLMRKIGLKTGKTNYESVTNAKVRKSVFNAAVEVIDDHFQKAINAIGEGELILTSFSGKFALEEILRNVFGDRDIDSFIRALAQCKRKILISLDGFDTHSEDFHNTTEKIATNSEEYRNRNEYEELFFRTLLEVVTQLKGHKIHDKVADALGEFADFCIVLPKDRFDSIIRSDRDSFKKKFGMLSWSAQELMELIYRRLEYLILTIDPAAKINTSLSSTDRMNAAFSFFKGLPTSIAMKVNGNPVSMTLFNYILRSSFWRPRDVISNISKIMAQMVRVKNNDWTSERDCLTEEDIKLSIKANAEKIIEEEFIGEYKNVFRNLPEVLRDLQGLDEQMDVQSFKDILKGIRFDASFSYDMTQVDNKLRVLYQLGVIGLLYSKRIASHQHYLNHICYEFNEGMAPLEDFLKHRMKEEGGITIVFNPIFGRRLMLNYNTKELIGNWSDEYIKANHRNKEIIHGL